MIRKPLSISSINKIDNKIIGVALVTIREVTCINKGANDYFKVEALVSTLNEKEKSISFIVFENSYKVSIETLKEFSEGSIENLKGMMFYMELGVNDKHFQEINRIFMKVKDDELVYDPRNRDKIIDLDIF